MHERADDAEPHRSDSGRVVRPAHERESGRSGVPTVKRAVNAYLDPIRKAAMAEMDPILGETNAVLEGVRDRFPDGDLEVVDDVAFET